MTNLIRLYDFDGGIHPTENKTQSTQTPIQQAPIPAELVLPLHQHIGAAAEPLVKVGDSVLKGQMLAEANGFVSVPLHAPTSGVIKAIEPRQVPHASGLEELCIVLKTDGKDDWCERRSAFDKFATQDLADISPADLTQHISDCGIAGMGGAGFPTAVKLHTGKRDISTLILNGAECEPYITADDMLMRERAREVISGAQILLHILDAKRCMIGVEDNKPEAIEALNAALVDLHEEHHIDVVAIPTKYPSGGEKQLIQILTGEEVPAGGIPADLGIVCQNVGTAAAISQAVFEGTPLISRVTTLTGDANEQPGNWEVLLGTPVNFLLELAGYQPQKRERVVMGGPMMGFSLPSLDLPVVKTTNCLLAPTEKELPANDIAMACIRCGMCADACPAELLPQQLYWFSKTQEFDKAEQHNLFDCIECGACSYVCPSHIPLVQYYRYAKGAVREERAAQAKAEKAKERFENRVARQEREKAEKEAKRKARAEAASKSQSAKKAAPTAGNAAPAASSAELEKLQKQLDGAQSALKKTQEKLDAAREDAAQAEKIPAFEAALEKTQSKIKDLAKQIAEAKKAAKAAPAAATDSDKGDPNSPERLKKKWETAQARLETAQKRLADAKEQGLDTVAALEEGIAKQQVRVNEAKAAYDASLSSDNSTAQTATAAPAFNPEQLEKLQKQLSAAQTAKTKTEEKLAAAKEDPEKADKIAAFEAALAKTQDKIKDLAKQIAVEKKAQKAAENAAPAAAEHVAPDHVASDKGDPNTPERLQRKLDTLQARLDTAIDRLKQAEAEGLDTVEKLKAGIERQQTKVDEVKAQLDAAQNGGDSSKAIAAETAMASTSETNSEQQAALEKKIRAQKDRVEKSQERLIMAQEQNLETVDALQKALDKQTDKLAGFEAELNALSNSKASSETDSQGEA
ncbi:electron transport complex subunit RsxC [Bacterioplanoides sp. SCSIO 12839]|uniref:electron transport complex subunit RsxC n=1 Tax=Bacterioplanoides sp. SCSIO 12839 TaxID=2829569 RepID=UPI00210340FB|nr:electron transport complex subunit RsxC [Bacterioplanoides sp. SCSIO 12839]UTW49850.1 electron transport complex subunit RsxC [Bacterioplanoides sp. SCSIO 12839]